MTDSEATEDRPTGPASSWSLQCHDAKTVRDSRRTAAAPLRLAGSGSLQPGLPACQPPVAARRLAAATMLLAVCGRKSEKQGEGGESKLSSCRFSERDLIIASFHPSRLRKRANGREIERESHNESESESEQAKER